MSTETYPGDNIDSVDKDQDTDRAVDSLKDAVYENVPEFTNIAERVRNESKSRYVDEYDYKQALERFRRRCNDTPQNSTSQDRYREIWEKKVNDLFCALIQALKEHHYFDNKNFNTEQQKVKDKYLKEVKRQYKDNILFADDKKFDRIKDNIFEKDSEECPANKVYKDLTGAATMFKVERRSISGYGSEVLPTAPKNLGTVETIDNKNNVKFLSNDFPEYLWNIKKTPRAINKLKWLPFVSGNADKPSEKDRKAIKDFLEVSSKLYTSGDKAIALLKVFQDNNLNLDYTKEDYKRLLNRHSIYIDDKNLGDIVKAGSFYLSTQIEGNSSKNQHAIYLSVLEIIKDEGGVNNVVMKYKNLVEQAKKEKETEKKEGFKDGEKLKGVSPDLYNIATKLGTIDYTNASRLFGLGADYFQNNEIERILANLDNDEAVNARDIMTGGLKSGKQFLDIYNQVGKEKALSNLLERAKLENKTLNLRLYDREFSEKQIKLGNKRLVLLLQNIISKPGEDLYTLLSKDTTKDPFEGIDLKKERERVNAYAKDMASKIDYDKLKESGLTLPTSESMQQGLAKTLYSEYTKGIGVGGKISFDEWIQGVSMNTGFQIRDDGRIVIGIGLSFSKKYDIGKGWTATPELSASSFIPIGIKDGISIDKISGNVGLNNRTVKTRITDSGVEKSFGFDVGASVSIPSHVPSISVGFVWEQDKSKGIDVAEQRRQEQFQSEIIKPVLDNVYKLSRKVVRMDGGAEGTVEGPFELNFDNVGIVDALKKELQSKAESLGIEKKDIDKVVNATIRLLMVYNGTDISKEEVRDIIAQRIAEQYAMSWSEAKKAEIAEGKGYISGAGLGGFWIVGTKFIGIHASVKWTDHDLDGYGDRFGDKRVHEAEMQGSEWTKDMLDKFNQTLGLSENEQLRLNDEGFVVIPASVKNRVRVGKNVKGLMKMGENGDVLIHRQTPMSSDILQGAGIRSSEIVVGKKEGGKRLDTVGNDRFTEGEINQNDVLNLHEQEKHNVESLNKVLDDIKGGFPEEDLIQSFSFVDNDETKDLLERINNISQGKKMRIVLFVQDGKVVDGNPTKRICYTTEEVDGRGLDIEYQSKFEMMDPKAKKIGEDVYKEALKVDNPGFLYNVKHQPRSEYKEFRTALESEDYTKAKGYLEKIFEKLDRKIGSNFKLVLKDLNSIDDSTITGKAAIGQALMSINNIFARSRKVIGGKGKDEYSFTVEMGEIIKERAGNDQIRGTISRYFESQPEIRDAYLALIDALEKYRKDNPALFNKKSAPSAQLENTVGFNLGDKSNPLNLLFNPEIYDPKVKLDELDSNILTADKKEIIYRNSMEVFANSKPLITPVLKYLGVSPEREDGKLKLDKEPVRENGKLKLDIGGKKVILSGDLVAGYFTQCVNHTVILSNISAEIQGGVSVKFNSKVWNDGVDNEGNIRSNVSSRSVAVDVGVNINTSPDSGNQDSGVQTTDDTKGGKRGNTNPSDSNEVTPPPPPPPAGGGSENDSGAGEV